MYFCGWHDRPRCGREGSALWNPKSIIPHTVFSSANGCICLVLVCSQPEIDVQIVRNPVIIRQNASCNSLGIWCKWRPPQVPGSFVYLLICVIQCRGLSARSAGLLVGRNSLELPALGSLRLTCFLVLTIDNEVNGKHQTISIGLTNCRCYVRISCHEGDCGCVA